MGVNNELPSASSTQNIFRPVHLVNSVVYELHLESYRGPPSQTMWLLDTRD